MAGSNNSHNAGSGEKSPQFPLSPSQMMNNDNFNWDDMGVDFNFETNLDEFDQLLENMNGNGAPNDNLGLDVDQGADDMLANPDGLDLDFGTADPSLLNQAPQEMVPMQQNNTFAPMAPMGFAPGMQQTPTLPMPTPPPGLAYHPAIGWYMPVAQPQVPPPSFGTPINSFAPEHAPSFSAPSAPPPAHMASQTASIPFDAEIMEDDSAVTTALKTAAKRRSGRSSSKKVKYGPAYYLKRQAIDRAEGNADAPRPVSRDSVSFYVAPKHRATATTPEAEDEGSDFEGKSKPKAKRSRGKGAKSDGPVISRALMKEMQEAIVQVCHCQAAQDAAAQHVPRPRNPFIIFRADFSARFRPLNGKKGAENTNISKEAGDAWKKLGKGQDMYIKRAKEEKEKHKQLYPNYYYNPARKITIRFGQPDCACGAYAVNNDNLLRKRAGLSTPPGWGEMPHADFVGQRTRSRSRSAESGRQPFRAPVAQMTNSFDLTEEAPRVHFSTERQQIEYANAIARKRAASAEPEDDEEPIAKRRSGRNGRNVNYAEPVDEDMESLFIPQASPRSRRRPSAISVSSFKSADFDFDLNGPPAQRTRSRSIASHASELSDLGSLFDDAEAEEDDENIVVATPSPRSKATAGLALPIKPAGVTKRMATRSQSRGRPRKRS